jgi:hypothetical protein
MDAQILMAETIAAFADVPWPHDPPPEVIEPGNALKVAGDLFLYSDDTKKYELPRLMCLAITSIESPLRSRLLCRLIEFMDVDFDDPERTNNLLKDAKRRVFSTFSESQSMAIRRWLEYVQKTFELTDCQDLLTSAIEYSRKPTNPPDSRPKL